MSAISSRSVFLAVFLVCAGLLGYGLYLQHVQNQEPCPLCILQRYAFIAVGVIALVAAAHGPRRVGQAVYGLLIALAAGSGAGIAARQSWLQHNPPNVLDCGPDFYYMLDAFPLSQVLPKIFKGEGDCAKVTWTFLGLSIAEWALLWFALFLLTGLYLMIARRPRAGA
jgi:disulfide bond formation protein DsbB